MLIESSCIFRFGFTFPGCKYVLPYFGQADLCQGVADVLGWQNAPPVFPGLLDKEPEGHYSSLLSLSEQGFSKGNKGSERQEKGLGDL